MFRGKPRKRVGGRVPLNYMEALGKRNTFITSRDLKVRYLILRLKGTVLREIKSKRVFCYF